MIFWKIVSIWFFWWGEVCESIHRKKEQGDFYLVFTVRKRHIFEKKKNYKMEQRFLVAVNSVVHEYFEKMIPKDNTMKVLLVDRETLRTISVVYTQTQLLERGVFLVDLITNGLRKAMPSMKAIIFVRPTSESLRAVTEEVHTGRYSTYSICFSNAITTEQLDQLAKCDAHEIVDRVEE